MKLLKIVKARLKKESKEQFVKDRIIICLKCPKNTKNIEKIDLRNKISKFFSKALDIVMFVKRKDYGACSICTCPIALLTEDINETCGEEKLGNKSKWKL